MDIIGILEGIDWGTLFGAIGAGGLTYGGFSVYARRKARAEADKALEETIDIKNITIKEQSETISALIKELGEKIEWTRTLEEKVWENQRRLRIAMEEHTRLEKLHGDYRVLVEHYKGWHCQNSECPHRVPPNPQLVGRKYEPPVIDYHQPQITNC